MNSARRTLELGRDELTRSLRLQLGWRCKGSQLVTKTAIRQNVAVLARKIREHRAALEIIDFVTSEDG